MGSVTNPQEHERPCFAYHFASSISGRTRRADNERGEIPSGTPLLAQHSQYPLGENPRMLRLAIQFACNRLVARHTEC